MKRFGNLTEHRKHFVEAYCRLGNGTMAAREAGYKDSKSLVNQASKLKRELAAEISEELRSSFMNAAPKALSILTEDLGIGSVSCRSYRSSSRVPTHSLESCQLHV